MNLVARVQEHVESIKAEREAKEAERKNAAEAMFRMAVEIAKSFDILGFVTPGMVQEFIEHLDYPRTIDGFRQARLEGTKLSVRITFNAHEPSCLSVWPTGEHRPEDVVSVGLQDMIVCDGIEDQVEKAVMYLIKRQEVAA